MNQPSSTLMSSQEYYTTITILDNLVAHYQRYLSEEDKKIVNSTYEKLNKDLSLDDEGKREIDKIYTKSIRQAMGEKYEGNV